MARAGLDKEVVIRTTAKMVNKMGMKSITLKMIAEKLGDKMIRAFFR